MGTRYVDSYACRIQQPVQLQLCMLLSCGMFLCAYRCFLPPKSLVSYLYVDFQEPSCWSIAKVFVASRR